MKGFGTFDTTNTLYGSFYSRQQDPITNIPKYTKPNMEEEFYERTIEMQKGYFNRYAHLYKDPTGKPIYNPIDGKAFKEEDAQRLTSEQPQQLQPKSPEQEELQNTHTYSGEIPEKETIEEPVVITFHRNFEAEKQ